ncbi:MAG: hypothetical protein U0744_11445 [Gemmataceae bacterium]
MTAIPKETLEAYLDDALSDAETADVERAIRDSEPIRKQLKALMQSRDRGEHSVGAIWRRHHLSCPSREQLGSYLLGAMDADMSDYVQFHLQTVGCSACLANLADLQLQRAEEPTKATTRRKRYYDSTAGLLRPARKG